VTTIEHAAPGAGAHVHGHGLLAHHFEDLEQQRTSATLGMWTFLATEVMFFGGLFAGFVIYRFTDPRAFALACRELLIWAGTINTAVLLTSSLTMALAVRAAQLRDHRWLLIYLGLTMAFGAAFLGFKAVEYTEEFHEHLVPGWYFRVHEHDVPEFEEAARAPDPRHHLNPGRYEMFFVLYFFMTGLHAIHLVVGIALVGVMAYLSYHRWFSGGGATQIEVTGLYWHFIDIVWVYLYPMLYLINVHS
jgi:cytochrome c oxidase subunit 3